MSIKARIEKLEQASGRDAANILLVVQQPGETLKEAKQRRDREMEAAPGTMCLLVTFVGTGGEA